MTPTMWVLVGMGLIANGIGSAIIAFLVRKDRNALLLFIFFAVVSVSTGILHIYPHPHETLRICVVYILPIGAPIGAGIIAEWWFFVRNRNSDRTTSI